MYPDRIIPTEVGRQSNGSEIMGVVDEDKGTPGGTISEKSEK